MFLYDITNTASFVKLSDWFAVVRKATSERDIPDGLSDCFRQKEPYMALIGNKCKSREQWYVYS